VRPAEVRRHCRESIILGEEGQARQRYDKGFASTRTGTSLFIFGKVDVPRFPMHLQGEQTLAPNKVSKSPPLHLESYTLPWGCFQTSHCLQR
jgi:hypothetical protein